MDHMTNLFSQDIDKINRCNMYAVFVKETKDWPVVPRRLLAGETRSIDQHYASYRRCNAKGEMGVDLTEAEFGQRWPYWSIYRKTNDS